MRVPQELSSLVDIGIIQEVVRPLMSGKEAQVYVVIAGGEQRVAKVYKEAARRSFKQRADYTEGRKVRNTRDRRAMSRRSRHGKAQDEAGWRSAEVDVIYRLREAGVRVPAPYNFYDGVLVMELVTGADGLPAPRLGDLSFTPTNARAVYDRVIQDVVRMLCAGVVHGDLSDFNVLMSADGPVIIDFPQAVDPASNSSARSLLIRDVDNLHSFLGRTVRHPRAPFAQEMWSLFERNELGPETRLSGQFRDKRRKANTKQVLDLIGDAARDEERRQRSQQEQGGQRRGRSRRGAKGGAAQAQQVQVLVRAADGRAKVLRPGAPTATATSAKAKATPANGKATSARGKATSANGKATSANGKATSARGKATPARGKATPAKGGATPTNARQETSANTDDAPAKKKRRRRRRRPRSKRGPANDAST